MSDTPNLETGAPSPDKFAALDLIGQEAAGDERAREQAQAEAAKPEGYVDEAQAWAIVPKKLGSLLGMAVPELKDVYTDDACLEWGKGMAAVSHKYGWNAADTLAKFAPELALAAATLELALPTYMLVSAKLEQVRLIRAQRQAPSQPMRDLNEPPGPGGPVPAGQQQPGNFDEPR